MKRITKLIFTAVCALATFLSAAGATTNTIQVFDFDYGVAPSTHVDPTINVGDTIEWVWAGGTMQHSTTAAASQTENWESGLHPQPFTFFHTFTHAGTFSNYCTLHGFDLGGGQVGGMSGHIFVVSPQTDVRHYTAAGKGQFFDQTDTGVPTNATAFQFIAKVRGTSSNAEIGRAH